MLVGAIGAGTLGLATAPLLLRGADLTRLMVSMGVALMLGEIANRAAWLTDGADGLEFTMNPLPGLFKIGFTGQQNAALYSLVVLFLLFMLARRIAQSPFGLSLTAIRENRLRADALGISTARRIVANYAVAAVYAGIAGALLAQTTAIISLDLLEFHRSADVLLMLIIGGSGYLYGGLIGAAISIVLKDAISGATPEYWQFWIGALLVALVLIGRALSRGRYQDGPSADVRDGSQGRRGMNAPALEARGLMRRFGGLVATDNVSFSGAPGARQALIGPNGAGKTTLINLLTGIVKPSEGSVLLGGQDITSLSSSRRVRRGLARTFQINQLFPGMSPAEAIGLAISERHHRGADFWRVAGRRADIADEIDELLSRFGLTSEMDRPTHTPPYGKQRLLEIALALACSRGFCCLTSPLPACVRKNAKTFSPRLPRSLMTSRSS